MSAALFLIVGIHSTVKLKNFLTNKKSYSLANEPCSSEEILSSYFSKIWPSITDAEVLTENTKYCMYNNALKNRHELVRYYHRAN